jgi:anti-sigma regulatory factor (Ser/Thr protein kinase)
MTEIRIDNRFDTLEAQRQTKQFAFHLGFSRRACAELAIVVSELSSNILKYGRPGRILLAEVNDAGRRGIGVRAYDVGPPFRDLESAVKDGCDDVGPIDPASIARRGGFGTGLGAIIRFTHSFRVEPLTRGKCVEVTRYLPAGRSRPPLRAPGRRPSCAPSRFPKNLK